jgi:hypothetical protein
MDLLYQIRVITKLPNTEQSSKGKGKTHKLTNRQNQPTTSKLNVSVCDQQRTKIAFKSRMTWHIDLNRVHFSIQLDILYLKQSLEKCGSRGSSFIL